MGDHLVDHIHHHDLRSDNTLHVVGVVSNPVRYNSRYRLARQWAERMRATPFVKLHVVEAAFGDRHHELRQNGEDHLEVRTASEIWIKENMINLGVRHLLPRDWRYVAWVDTDIEFRDPDWARETLHELQHYPVLQPWSDSIELGPKGEILRHRQSFGSYDMQRRMQTTSRKTPEQERKADPCKPYYGFGWGHTGYAWAATRGWWEQVQGLIDFGILGAGDWHMAWAMIGRVHEGMRNELSENYKRLCFEWQERAVRMGKHVGYLPGRIEHYFHGAVGNRKYDLRHETLVRHAFDPVTDLRRDAQGLIQLVGKPELEQDIRWYNRTRSEDDISVD